VKDSLTLSFLTVILLLVNFIFNIAVANFFGIDFELDAYYASLTVNNVLISIAISSINFAILPSLIKLYREKKYKDLKKTAISLFNILSLIFIFLSFLQIVFARQIIGIIFHTFSNEVLNTTIELYRCQCVISSFILMNGYFVGLNYLLGRFKRTIIIPIIGIVVQFVIFILLRSSFGIFSLVYSYVGSIIINFILYFSPYFKHYNFIIIFSDELKYCWDKIYPLLLLSIFTRTQLLLDNYFSSEIGGAITSLFYGTLIIGAVSRVVNSGLSAVSLRRFSFLDHSLKSSADKIKEILELTIIMVLIVAASLVLFANELLRIVFNSKNIVADEIELIYWIIVALLGKLIFGLLSQLVINVYYANGLTKLVAKFSIISIMGLIALKFLFFKIWGVIGICIATTLMFSIDFIVQLYFYRRKIFDIRYFKLFRFFTKNFIVIFLILSLCFIFKMNFENNLSKIFLSGVLYFILILVFLFSFHKSKIKFVINKLK